MAARGEVKPTTFRTEGTDNLHLTNHAPKEGRGNKQFGNLVISNFEIWVCFKFRTKCHKQLNRVDNKVLTVTQEENSFQNVGPETEKALSPRTVVHLNTTRKQMMTSLNNDKVWGIKTDFKSELVRVQTFINFELWFETNSLLNKNSMQRWSTQVIFSWFDIFVMAKGLWTLSSFSMIDFLISVRNE